MRWNAYGNLPSHTRGGSRMRESRTYGSVRGACDETHVPTATCARQSWCDPAGESPAQVKGSVLLGSECCVATGDSGCEAYTAIAWGVGLSLVRSDIAGAEQLELHRQLHRQFGCLCALQNLSDVAGCAVEAVSFVNAIAEQAVIFGEDAGTPDDRQSRRRRRDYNSATFAEEHRVREYHDGLRSRAGNFRKRAVEIVRRAHREGRHLDPNADLAA